MINSTFTDKNFEQELAVLCKNRKEEVFHYTYHNTKYWIKKARPTSSNIFHKMMYKLLPYDFLVPVQNKSKEDALLFEVNKIKEFKSKGISSSEIIAFNKDFFVMSDTGIPLYSLLKKKEIQQDEFYYYLDRMITCLCDIHKNGMYHGGAQTRNFTYQNGIVSAIDFEDSFSKEIDIKVLQFRDLFLLLISMTKIKKFKVDYLYIIKKYVEQSSNEDFVTNLKKLANDLEFLLRLNCFSGILPEDVKSFLYLLQELKNIK